MLWCLRLIGVGVGRFDGINGNYGQREQLAGARAECWRRLTAALAVAPLHCG